MCHRARLALHRALCQRNEKHTLTRRDVRTLDGSALRCLRSSHSPSRFSSPNNSFVPLAPKHHVGNYTAAEARRFWLPQGFARGRRRVEGADQGSCARRRVGREVLLGRHQPRAFSWKGSECVRSSSLARAPRLLIPARLHSYPGAGRPDSPATATAHHPRRSRFPDSRDAVLPLLAGLLPIPAKRFVHHCHQHFPAE